MASVPDPTSTNVGLSTMDQLL